MIYSGRRSGSAAVSRTPAAYSSLNCYEELLEDKCVVLPFEQLTYIDSRNIQLAEGYCLFDFGEDEEAFQPVETD